MISGVGGTGGRYWAWVIISLVLCWAFALTYHPGELFLRNLLNAIHMRDEHSSENAKFDTTFPAALCQQWLAMIWNWESDKSNPDPYTHKEEGSSQPIHCNLS